MEVRQKMNKVVALHGNLSPLEEYFRNFDIGKANWSTAEIPKLRNNKSTTTLPKKWFNPRHGTTTQRKNNMVIFIYGNQGCQPKGSKVLNGKRRT